MLRQALLIADGFHLLTFEEEWALGRRDRLGGVWSYATASGCTVGIRGRSAERREGDPINVRTYRIGQHEVGWTLQRRRGCDAGPLCRVGLSS
jgi:hypothetical protein